MAGLPKKYAKMGFKKGWAAFKRTKSKRKSPRTKTKTTRRRNTMAKRNYSRRARGIASNPMVRGAGISLGGNIGGRVVGIDPGLAKLGLSAVGPLKNKTVLGFMLGEMIQSGSLGGVSGIFTGGGVAGAVKGGI